MGAEHCKENCSYVGILSEHSEHLRIWSAILAILSSSASIIGCLLIIITYVCWKDFRTTARSILVFISIADLFTASGYVVGSAIYLHYKIYDKVSATCNHGVEDGYKQACEWQSFVTTSSSIASFFWTTILAFYLYMTIVHKMYKFVRRLMPVIYLVSWGVPIVLCTVAMTEGWLGPSLDDTSVSWCFITDDKPKGWHPTGELLLGKGWEMISYILVIFFYSATKIFIELEVSEYRLCYVSFKEMWLKTVNKIITRAQHYSVCVCVCIHMML